MKAEVLLKSNASLGEGPLWLPYANELMWVDINKGKVHNLKLKSNQDAIVYHGDKTACVLPLSKNVYLIADTNKLIKYNKKTSAYSLYLEIDFKDSNVRFNDGKIDPNGTIWIGTMDMDATPNKGSLYRIDSKKNVSEVLQGVSISNGLAWALDGKTMYYIDTFENVVYAFDFNDKSEISNQRIAINVPKNIGAPDGMTIDNKGNLWVAMWGGSAVICWNPKSGQILYKIEVEAPHVTSCVFGGKDMDTLFITTAREGLSEKDLEAYPLSGSLFYIKLKEKGVKGYFLK
ncbi:SMP-30/gluconolactonase/LRE family protein [Tamlana sp. 2201CG12-4]|uniref:SMP-30/gluconolactonase/LRE family protein n=1 Tax=Tamlana sp. 2201CG12-4 TaxID=3112582 RepID=UPI002DB83888|nr:SMP-30/gluconolactonase/LRE family protein [Tamlana sp. 2201CG12-4]MEC3907882.1 SMP-30/gluconolactonase/LRE family protein [Tamlana sp. 2201CG12-4]